LQLAKETLQHSKHLRNVGLHKGFSFVDNPHEVLIESRSLPPSVLLQCWGQGGRAATKGRLSLVAPGIWFSTAVASTRLCPEAEGRTRGGTSSGSGSGQVYPPFHPQFLYHFTHRPWQDNDEYAPYGASWHEHGGTISLDKEGLYLDKLQVEKERGITVRAHTTSLTYKHSDGHPYLLNLIDTPGHVDFTYEVSRSLAACQGALLLVDCTQGIQAQTVANYFLAFEANLKIIPVLNKIDLPTSEPARVARELVNIGFEEGEILKASGKTGEGVDSIFEAVIQRLPPPSGDPSKPLKALLFENWYDQFRGVVCLINVLNGSLKKGDKVVAASSNKVYELENVGILFPERVPTGALYTGQVGYIIGGMRSTKEARVGDTLYHEGTQVEPLPGFKPAKPMVGFQLTFRPWLFGEAEVCIG